MLGRSFMPLSFTLHAQSIAEIKTSIAQRDRISAGHPIFAAKGAGLHNKRRAKRFARTRGMNKSRARRR